MPADAKPPGPAAPGDGPPDRISPSLEQLKASEAKYRALFEAESDAVLLIDNATGRILEANDAAATLYGYSRDEILRLTESDLSAEPEDTRRVPTTTPIQPDTAVRVPLRRHRRKGGAVISVEITGRFFEWERRPVHLAAIRDISARVQTEEALRKSQADLRMLMQNIPGAVYRRAVEAPWRIEFISEGCEAITGFRSAYFMEAPGRPYAVLVLPEDLPEVDRLVREGVQGRRPYDMAYRIRHADGSVRWVQERGRAVYDDEGRPLWLDGVILDITERKPTEETLAEHARQLEAVRAVSAEIIQELHPGTVLRLVAERACALTGAAAADIDLWDEESQTLVPEVSHGHATPRPGTGRRLGEGAMGTVAETRQGLVINDYRSSRVAHPETLAHTQIVASLVEPLLFRDRLLGVIGVDHETPGRTFSEQDQATLHLFAAQAAIAIANARLYQEEQARRAQLEAVRELSAEITRELNLDRLLHLLIARAAALVGAVSATVYLWDPEQGVVVPAAWHGLGEWQAGLRHPLGRGISGMVAQTRRGLLVNDYRSSPHANPATLERTRVTASLGEPLIYRDALIGVITVNHEGGKTFSAEDQAIARLFASQAAVAIQNARLHTAAVRRGAELEALLSATRSVMSGLELETILDRIVAQAQQISGAPHVKVALVDREANLLRVGAVRGSGQRPGEVMPLDRGASGLVARTGQPLFSPDHQDDPRNLYGETDRALGIVTYLGLPITRGEEVLGVLTFNTTVPKTYSPEELDYLTAFAAQAAIAIENARLFSATQQALANLRRAQAEMVRTEQLRGLGQMAAGIAHDLNNMLATVLGQTELAKLNDPSPALRDILGLIETAAADGAAVVRRLQDFARPRGASPLSPCDLGALIRETVEFTRPRWHEEPQRRGCVIRVDLALPADLPPVLGHPPELREALTNLIFNAADAMPQGGTLTLAARVVPLAAGARGVELVVGDTGVGMTAEVRAKLFEPFFTTKGVRGTGLGLAVVYGILERHGGTIAVASAPGEGTTFTLTFQVAPESAAPASASPPAAPSPPALRLLVVDDEPLVRQTLVTLLRATGHSASEAVDGPSALACLEQAAVDVVITDLGMPGMSGWELAGAIKARWPSLPILLLTGWQEQMPEDEGNRQFVDAILGKPVRLGDLVRALEEILARERSREESPG